MSDGSAPLLDVQEIVVHYGRIAALHGVSLRVNEGEAVAVIGPNGAGKSTTLAAITGCVRLSSGSIFYEDSSLAGMQSENIVRRGVALVPEGRRILGTLTVGENLQLGATPRRGEGNARAALESVLERFPILRSYYRSPAGKLSGGEQQQLAIARALLSQPRLLLLDEPSLGLGPLVVDSVFDVLADLRNDGVTILLIEQSARAIVFADRTYILRTGRVVHSGTREELASKPDLLETYLGF